MPRRSSAPCVGRSSLPLVFKLIRRGVSRCGATALVSLTLAGCVFRTIAASDQMADLASPAYDRGWQVTSFAVEAGLANQRVFDIAFERDGTVWVASSDGLRRYDGYRWQRFGTSAGLPSSFTRAVLVTRSGELWVGSDAGAGVFDPVALRYDPRGSEAGLASSNVRQITEDPEGSLWFCCDQWPDTSRQRGGLTLCRQGRWMTFTRNDGLPVDYVIGYFRDSRGRQFALTPRGWMQRSGDAWTPPLNPGYEAEDRVLQMAEAAAGTLFAQGEQRLLILADGRWQPHGTETVLVTRTADGQVVAVAREAGRGRLWFCLWNGREFVRTSARFPAAPGARLYRLRQAPDGSLWCVGYDTVMRWSYQAGPWTYYPEMLPLPSAAFVGSVVPDQDGSLWMGTSDGVLHYRAGTALPETILNSSVTEVRPGAQWPVTFRGIVPFTTTSAPEAFRYSWRIDGEKWTPFQDWPGPLLMLPELAPGPHRLQARARDWNGHVDPTPAVLEFVVLPTALQQRFWFKPLVVLVLGVIAFLSWLRLAHTRQIARANAVLREEVTTRRRAEIDLEKARGELERRVTQRTADLLRANASLSREIDERRTAEEARRRLEEQLRQAQKLEAIGTLAGGIAHDFNNILAAIIPYTHLAIEDAAAQPTVVQSLNQVLLAAERARNLVQQVLMFSRQQRQEPHLIELQPLVKEVLKLLRSALPATVDILSSAEPDVPPVLADPTEIHQVLMNLCTNAEHAMRGRQGCLDIRLGSVWVEAEVAAQTPGLTAGRYVKLSVRDNGDGMSPEIVERIFDPFFTTKGPCEGTGLGLAVVHGIVKNCDGVVRVHSQPGEGTEFEVLLPAREGREHSLAPPEPGPPRGRGERILLVDDEPAVASVLSRSLARAGYRVTAYDDPKVALENFRSRPEPYDLVFTDLTMAGLTGIELTHRIHEIRPDLPVVLVTGFDQGWTSEAAAAAGIRRVLQKPFDAGVAAAVVREVLDAGDSG